MSSPQVERLKRRMAAIPEGVKQAVVPALIRSGDELVGRMRTLCPVDSGKLRDSITATPPGQATPPYSQPGGSTVVPENAVMVTAGDKDVRYAALVEFGTSHSKAEPYFWPAFRLTRKRIQNRIKRSISKAVRAEWVK